MRYNQPDIREHGRLFSYTLIYVLNLLTVGAALVAISSWTYREALADVGNNLRLLAAAAHTFCEWARTQWPTPS